MTRILLLLLVIITSSAHSQETAFTIYNAKGKKVSFKKMAKVLAKKDVVLFGEQHNNPIAHWLQLELTKTLNQTNSLELGAEMFEADNQDQLNGYLHGYIDAKAFDTVARLWPNYKTDYAPLVDFAKDNKLNFTATNIPRRFASAVYKKGFEALDSLTTYEKEWVAPLPFPYDNELPTYKAILAMMGDHGSPKLVMSQASKDATMAHFILKNHQKGTLFLHFNGAYHSDKYEGILWYLKQEKPDLSYATISTILQEDISSLEVENENIANFIICVDADMTTTY